MLATEMVRSRRSAGRFTWEGQEAGEEVAVHLLGAAAVGAGWPLAWLLVQLVVVAVVPVAGQQRQEASTGQCR